MGLLDYAKSMIGKNENVDRSALIDYMRTGGVNLDPATTAWCAAFVNATLAHAGLPGSGSNMAKSFTTYGSNAIGNPQPGDIAVFNRGASAISAGTPSPLGHAGIIESINPQTGMMNVIGGNSGDMVRSRPYEISSAMAIRHPGDPTNATTTPVPASGHDALFAPPGNNAAGSGGAPSLLAPPLSMLPPLIDTTTQPGNGYSPASILAEKFRPMQDAMQSFQQGYSADRFMSDMFAGQNPMRRMVFGALGNLYRSTIGASS